MLKIVFFSLILFCVNFSVFAEKTAELEIIEVDAARIPASCEGSMDWMLQRALQ